MSLKLSWCVSINLDLPVMFSPFAIFLLATSTTKFLMLNLETIYLYRYHIILYLVVLGSQEWLRRGRMGKRALPTLVSSRGCKVPVLL